MLITIGLRGKSEPRFGSSDLRHLLATLYGHVRRTIFRRNSPARPAGIGFDSWNWQWLAFPDTARPASRSERRYRNLRSGTVDATTVAGSAWMVARLEDHLVYLDREGSRGALDFGRDMARLLRSLMLAPIFKPARWRPLMLSALLILASAALAAGILVLAWPRSPVLFVACGSTTVADEYFKSDLVLRDAASGTRDFLKKELCRGGELRAAYRTVDSNSEVSDEVDRALQSTLGFIPSGMKDNNILALPLSPTQLARDLYYVDFSKRKQGRLASGQAQAFLDSLRSNRLPIRLRFCGSSSIGDDILPTLIQDFVEPQLGQVSPKVSRVPLQVGEGETVPVSLQGEALIPTTLYEYPEGGVGGSTGLTGNQQYVIEVVTPGSDKMEELLKSKLCDIGMKSSGTLSSHPDTWSDLRWGIQYVYALQPVSADVSWESVPPVLCGQAAASKFKLALRFPGSGTRREVVDHVCQEPKRAPLAESLVELRSNTDIVNAIAGSLSDKPGDPNNPNNPVVGFAPEAVFRLTKFDRHVKIVHARSGDEWKISRELVFYLDNQSRNSAEANHFWDFLRKERQYYRTKFDLSPVSQCIGAATGRPRCTACSTPYPQNGDDAQRLDTDIVFKSNETSLSAQSGAIHKILAEAKSDDCNDRDVLVLGIESSPRSQQSHLDQQRAAYVADQLEKAGLARERIRYAGVGSDKAEGGLPRVEIWLVPHQNQRTPGSSP